MLRIHLLIVIDKIFLSNIECIKIPVISAAKGGNSWGPEEEKVEIEVEIEVVREVEVEHGVAVVSVRAFDTNILSCASHCALMDFSAKCSVTTHTCPSSDWLQIQNTEYRKQIIIHYIGLHVGV